MRPGDRVRVDNPIVHESIVGVVYVVNGDLVDVELSSGSVDCFPRDWVTVLFAGKVSASTEVTHAGGSGQDGA